MYINMKENSVIFAYLDDCQRETNTRTNFEQVRKFAWQRNWCSGKYPARRQIFAATIVNGECGETNFRCYALAGVHDICVRAGNRQTPTSGGVNVAATRNSISRSCSNAFAAASRRSRILPGTQSSFLKSDPDLGSRNVTENSRVKSENRANRRDTRAWRKSSDANFRGTTVAKFHWFRSRSQVEWQIGKICLPRFVRIAKVRILRKRHIDRA